MRTTLTLDEDVAEKLKAEMHRRGETLKETVNQLLRRGFEAPGPEDLARPFRVEPTRPRGSGSKRSSRRGGRCGSREGQANGPQVMDAHLAALAAEHGLTLATTDRDFLRFPGVEVTYPLAGAR